MGKNQRSIGSVYGLGRSDLDDDYLLDAMIYNDQLCNLEHRETILLLGFLEKNPDFVLFCIGEVNLTDYIIQDEDSS